MAYLYIAAIYFLCFGVGGFGLYMVLDNYRKAKRIGKIYIQRMQYDKNDNPILFRIGVIWNFVLIPVFAIFLVAPIIFSAAYFSGYIGK